MLSTKCVPSIIRTDSTLNLKQRGRLGSDAWLWHTLALRCQPGKILWSGKATPVLRPDVPFWSVPCDGRYDQVVTPPDLTDRGVVHDHPAVLFYAGLVRVKNMLSVKMQCLR